MINDYQRSNETLVECYINIFKNFYEEEKYIKDYHDSQDLMVWLIRNYSNMLYMVHLGEEHTDTFEKIALETTEIFINLLKMEDIDINFSLESEDFSIEGEYEAILSNLTTITLLLNTDNPKSFKEFLEYHQNELINLLYILL
jgi:hypothetical protein